MPSCWNDYSNALVNHLENGPASLRNNMDFIRSSIRLIESFASIDKAGGLRFEHGTAGLLESIQEGVKVVRMKNVDASGLETLSEELKRNSTLSYLEFERCQIGDKGAQILGDALRENTSLMYLCMGDCGIGADGAQALSNMLRENSTLLCLDINRNEQNLEGSQYGNDIVQILSEGLQENSVLSILNLAFNKTMNDESALCLAKVLRENTSLSFLSLGYCDITRDGAATLSSVLDENSTLKYLILYGNNLDDVDLVEEMQRKLDSRFKPERSFEECCSRLQSFLE